MTESLALATVNKVHYVRSVVNSELTMFVGNFSFSGSAKFTPFGIRLLLFSHGSRLPPFSASVVQRRVREFRTRAWCVQGKGMKKDMVQVAAVR